MNTLDYIGIGLLIVGILIFIVTVFIVPRFRDYKGEEEYKEVRKEVAPKRKVKKELNVTEEALDNDGIFMPIAMTTIGIAIVLMVGYIVVDQTRDAMTVSPSNISNSDFNLQSSVFAGFSLVAIGIIVLGAFGLISIFTQ